MPAQHHMKMRKKKPYHFPKTIICLLILQSIVLYSCSQHKKNTEQDSLLSMIITSDSVTVYSGDLGKNTSYKQIPIDETNIKDLFSQRKKEARTDLTLLLKLSGEAIKDGFMAQIADVIRWTKQSGISNIELDELSEMDQSIFKLRPVPWSYIDSFSRPSSLSLKMPKEERSLNIEKIDKTAPYVLSVLITSPDDWYWYTGPDTTDVRLFNRKQYSELLKEKKKKWGNKLIVLAKLAPGAVAESIIAALEEKATSRIENYEIIYPPPPIRPKRKLTAEDFLLMPPPPVAIETPNTVRADQLPEDNAFLIEIKEDNSVWYQPRSLVSRIISQEIKRPISANLQKIIAGYKAAHTGIKIAYLIKGHPKSTYPVFEQVINALKANNINKYILVTLEE